MNVAHRAEVFKPASFGRRTIHGLALMLAQNVISRACGLLSQIILAALLLPSDYGLIGLTYTVTNLAATLINIGIDDVLVQRKQALRLWIGPAFWISTGLAVIAGLLVVAAAPLAATLYKTPALIGLLPILALSMPINALSNIPGMILRAHMRFGFIAIYNTSEMITQAILTIVLAWGGFGAYSFAIPVPILAAIRAIIWWYLIPFQVDLRPQRRRWKYVVGNTAVNFASKTIIAIIGQGDYIVLGLLTSQDVVGSYYFGFRLAAQPLWILAGNLSGVLFPALVQLKGDAERQGTAALRASKLLAYSVMPLALIQAAIAAPLIGSLFNQKWAASIPVIQLLSVGLAFDAVSWVAGTFLNARGEFKRGLKYFVIQTPFFFVLVGLGALINQADGVAWGVCIYYAATQPVFVYSIYRRIGITFGQVAVMYVKPLSLATVSVGLGTAASMLPRFAGKPFVHIAVICVLSTSSYAVLLKLFAPDIWQELKGRVRDALERKGLLSA